MSHDHIPIEPTALTVAVTESRGVRLAFNGNNPPGSVFYLIWRMDGNEGRWLPRDKTEQHAYDDVNVIPGETYLYRVQAQSSNSVSDFSNTVAIQIPGASS